MSGQLAAFRAAGLPAQDMSRFKLALKGAAQAAKQAASGALLVRLVDGVWVYGPDDVEVQENSEWVVNPFSLAMGFAAWGEEKTPLAGTLVSERMALITETQIDVADLKVHDMAPWQPQVQFDALCLTGDDVGVLVRYKTTSVGGKRAFAGLMQEVSNQSDGDEPFVPVIEFMTDSYDHKRYGKTFVPVFQINDWKSPDDTTLGTASDEDQQQDADEGDEPAERRPKATASAAAEKVQEPTRAAAPARRAAAEAAATDVEEQPAETQQPRRRPATNGASAPAAEAAPAPRRAAAAPAKAASPAAPARGTVDRGAVVRRRRR